MYSRELQQVLRAKKISPGDRVRVEKPGEAYEGILLPSTEFGSPNALVIKLDSGYNIGVEWSPSASVTKTGARRKLEVFPSMEFAQKTRLPAVSVVVTGGTISSRVDYETGGVSWLMKPGQLFAIAPELAETIRLKKVVNPFAIASENVTARHWQGLARAIAKEIEGGAEGVVVTHGTDALHLTSAALSFMLKNLSKPVALTYAQRSSDRGSSDAGMNLACAAQVAASSDIAEVLVVGHADSSDSHCLVMRGTKVRKMHSSRRDAFRPVNEKPIAKVWPDGRIEVLNPNYRRRKAGEKEAGKKVVADTAFDERVALVKYHPGARPELIDFLVDEGCRGIVVEAMGLGHVASEGKYSWLPAIKHAIDEGTVVCAAAQTLYGRLDPFVYAPARKLLALGVVYCEDMLPEVAYVKLGFLLGHGMHREEVRARMVENLAGEINPRLTEEDFLK